jgi:glycosyltransferase involved in cell wall biosynthesis
MTPRRVALITSALGTGGVERQLLTLAAHLDRNEFAPELVSLKNEGPLAAEAQRLGVSHWSAEAGAGLDLGAVRRLARRLVQARYDTVLAANQYGGSMLRMAAALGHRPGLMLAAFHSSPALIGTGWRDQVRLRAYQAALRGFDRLLYVSSQQRSEWQARGFATRLPSDVIYNGIDVERFRSPPRRDVRSELGWLPGDFVVGLCAALRPEKRVHDLLEAASMLLSQGLPLRLLLIGDGGERRAIERRATQLGVAARLHIAGMQADVAPFIHACDVMTLVSSSEAFSIAVLEAMACGKPVVLTRVGGAAEQIESGHSGYLVEAGQPAQVAQRLAHIWRTGEAPRLGANARAKVERDFSLARMVERYARAFRGETLESTSGLATAVSARA